VPWLEGYTLRGRDAQQLRHQHQLKQRLLPPGLNVAAQAIAQTPPVVTTTDPKRGFSGDYGDVRPKKRVIVDVVKLKRLDVCGVQVCSLFFHGFTDRVSYRLH
jgi:hypothetical protein